MPVRLAIHGAGGRMGQRLVALAAADPELQVAAALESPRHPRLGEDAGLVAGVGALGVALADQLGGDVDVVIDFSVPEAVGRILDGCLSRRLPLVVATTGLDAEQLRRIDEAAATIPVLQAPNMSLAVNVAMKLTAMAARVLKQHPAGVDVEIIERHHRFKEDAPSGTALKFGEIIAAEMGLSEHRHGRQGRPGPRSREEIGYHAVRTGDNPGEHTIIFGLLGEVLEVSVGATSRDCYAHGALAAARFLKGKPAGRYSMADVLGL